MKSSIKPIFHQKTYKAMGGEFSYMCFPQSFYSRKEIEEIFKLAHDEVIRIQNKFTDFHPSAFNKINDLAGIGPCIVDSEIYDLIKKSIEISEGSNGYFDISFASIGHEWRKAKQINRKLSLEERNCLLEWVDYKKIILDDVNQSIFLPSKKMKIGLGGIGKGYAVDKAYKVLEKAGIYNFYINGSGDIRVHSNKNAPRHWKVGIKNPFSNIKTQSVGLIQLSNGAVATSGSYIQKIDNGDHHIINPKTGNSLSKIVSSTILSENCVTSDTAATIVMNMDHYEALNYLNQESLMGVLIDEYGKSHLSTKAINHFGF